MFKKIVSGGQTGVDRAALDAALSLEVPCGGWCPKGRKAEDGRLDARYPLKEARSREYAERTTLNVRDSDGTLVLTIGEPSGGTLQTINDAARLERPCLVLDISIHAKKSTVLSWAKNNSVRILNIAGPRESKSNGIYKRSFSFIKKLLSSEK